jgi:hypothetical protein
MPEWWQRNGIVARSVTTLQEFDRHTLDHGNICFYCYLTNGRCPERNQPMTNIPAKLIAEFATLTGRIEEAVRQDERHKLLHRMAAEYQDRNGETSSLNLGYSAAKKLQQRRGFHATSKLGKLYRCLAYRTYAVTKNTLMRESGMTEKGVYQGIATLRKQYQIDTIFGKGSKARYKLAS